jgi:MOSC domain-containing protein YiiM
MMMKVISVNSSRRVGEIKEPVHKGRFLRDYGMDGDAHGGSGRQVSLLARESYEKNEKTASLPWGSYAENITTEGIILHRLPVGARLKIGTVELEVTQIGKRCHAGCAIQSLTGVCVMPLEGIFARVVTEGEVASGDEIEILPG